MQLITVKKKELDPLGTNSGVKKRFARTVFRPPNEMSTVFGGYFECHNEISVDICLRVGILVIFGVLRGQPIL